MTRLVFFWGRLMPRLLKAHRHLGRGIENIRVGPTRQRPTRVAKDQEAICSAIFGLEVWIR